MPTRAGIPYSDRRISRKVKNRSGDTETQYCIQNDNSKNKNVDVKLTDFSSLGFAASHRENVASMGKQIHRRTRFHLWHKKKEEMWSEIGKTGDNNALSKVSEMPNFSIHGALLSSNLEPVGQIRNRFSVHEDSDFENEAVELELLDCSCGMETTEGYISKRSVQAKGCSHFFLCRSKCLLVSNIYIKSTKCCLENDMPIRNKNQNRCDI